MYADDADAMFILGKVKTILKHGGLDAHGHNPAVDKAFVELMNFTNDLISSLGTEVSVPRRHELMKLRWPLLDAPPPNVNWNKGWLYENETSLIFIKNLQLSMFISVFSVFVHENAH